MMQYLLTKEEFDGLISKDRYLATKEKLAEASRFIAEANGGCIQLHNRHYCDDCKAAKWCPYPKKEWSK